jgi:flagellar biosynthesis component FlhA
MGIYGFEERLAAARKDKGYTQDELSIKLGVTPQAVSKWERGMGYPDLEILYYISEILDCSIDYLMNKKMKREKLTEDGDENQRNRLLGEILSEPLVMETGNGLVPLLEEENKNMFSSISGLREELALQYGILLPLVRIKDNEDLGEMEYRILAYDKVLFSSIAPKEGVTFRQLVSCLRTICKEHYGEIINRQIVQTLVDNVAEKYPATVKGIIPEKISLSLLQNVLSRLVKKRGSIRNFIKILEILEEEIQHTQDVEQLTETILQKL